MPPAADDVARSLRARAELERAFGIDDILLPAAPPREGAPAPADTQREDHTQLSAPETGEEPPAKPPTPPTHPKPSEEAPKKTTRRSRRAAQAEPAEEEELQVIVVGSDVAETGQLFESGNDDFGERVPEVHALGLAAGEAIEKLKSWASDCHRCPLAETRNKLVFGEGSPKARLVFVGEAPGAEEDKTGRPFVGRAGKLLSKIIAAMGFEREDVYICNILKCRPPGNRNPNPTEVAACSPILREQLKVLGAEVIVALGSPSSKTLLETREGISKIRGRFHSYYGVPLMPTFHPAFLLRNPGEQYKRMVWEDMKAVLRKLGLPVPRIKRPT